MNKVNAHTLNHLSGDANINVIATLEDLCNGQHTSSTTIIVVLSIFVFSPFLFCQPDYFRSLIQHGSHGMA